MDSVRWLLVGAGDIARKRVAPALTQTTGSAIAAICDPRAETAAELAGQYGVDGVYADFAQAPADTAVDAVYLATPVWLHAEHAVQALRAGKHVLVEKPLGLSGEDAARVVKAAAKSRCHAACAYFRRFCLRYLHLQELLAHGACGRIISVVMIHQSWFNPTTDDPKYWRVVRDKSGAGVLSDMGSHMFDVLIGLLGIPARVFACREHLTQRWEVEDSANVVLQMPKGALVTAAFNWNSKAWRHEFDVVGTEARVTWLPYDSGPVIKTSGRETEQLDLPSPKNAHQPLVADFVEAIARGRPPRYGVAEAVKTNLVLDAISRSATERREVEIPREVLP